ncbi:twin-arginine translocation signal domain-containing protein [Actinopolymorpha sp. B17G11]|uniref:twin-arginine translocation signal domain-containing protein n=1 Tax=Actinopolymorpha sp. B17G11 TaxID=3160861 RepID=UPI0032E49D77
MNEVEPSRSRPAATRRDFLRGVGVAGASAVGLGAITAAPPKAWAAPTPPGIVTDFGVLSTALTLHEAHLGSDGDGKPVFYGIQMGTPGVISVIDPISRELLRTIPLAGSSGGWGITQASDGLVYAGTYYEGRLYQYNPSTDEVVDLGTPAAGQTYLYGLRPGIDGRVYGGTYSGAHTFSYSPAEGARDFGPMFEGQFYAVDTAVDPERNILWAAIGSAGHLVRLDLTTGEKRDILPEQYRDAPSYPYDINLVSGRLFVKLSQKGTAFVLDPDTGDVIADGFTMTSRGTSPLAPDGESVYFTSSGQLWRYDLTTEAPAPALDASGQPIATGAGVGWGFINGVLYAAIGNYAGQALWYDPDAGTHESFTLPFPPQAIDIANVTAGPDGKVYSNLFINGNMASFDPATETVTTLGRLGQADGFGWHDGLLYAGVYPYGGVWVYDPSQPYSLGTNPRDLFRLQNDHGQNRPVAITGTPDTLYVGSTPDYGQWGGALTAYDFATESYTVRRNIVTDQAVVSLAVVGVTLWGGSSIAGGGGTTPKATEAKLFAVDLATGEKTAEYTPVREAGAIDSLIEGPDRRLWGLAGGTLFVFDPALRTVVRRKDLPGGSSHWQDELHVNPDGYVYVSSDGQLLRIDPRSFKVLVIRPSGTRRLDQDDVGNLWFSDGARLLRYASQATSAGHTGRRG